MGGGILWQRLLNHSFSDGYLNATAMCKATNKRWYDYNRLDSTQAFINALILKTGIPAFKIIQTESGRYGGTWIHPQVAINLAQWCSPKIAVMVTEWIFELMTTGKVQLEHKCPTSALPPFMQRAMLNRPALKDGYFSVIDEVSDKIIAGLEQLGATFPEKFCPDISVVL